MENFDERGQQRVKEKNVYLLHLDAPRIIIIVSVFIGIMVLSFLVGMNMDKQREITDEIFSKKDPLIDLPMSDNSKERNLFDNSIPDTPLENGIALNTPDNNPAKSKDLILKGTERNREGSTMKDGGATTDLLTNDNIKEIIPPVKEVNKIAQKHTVKAAEKKGDIRKKEQRQRTRRKKRVVEVSSDKKRDALHHRKHFSIQVASYDRKSNAQSELDTLKGMRYDAFIDKKVIRGRKYYRVRIGPILSKKKAIRMLNEVQEIDRYEDSYLIRE